jgi:iron complex outermembrane receptor protein
MSEVANTLILHANLNVIFSDEYHPSLNLEDRLKQDALIHYKDRISLWSNDGRWDIALLGKTRPDVLMVLYVIDTPRR